MIVNVEKTVVVVFNKPKDMAQSTVTSCGKELKQEDESKYLGMKYFSSSKFHEAKQEKIGAAVKLSFTIQSKAVNKYFLHTLPIKEYIQKCVVPKLLYASQIWGVGCSKDGWKKVKTLQMSYYKRHFGLPV